MTAIDTIKAPNPPLIIYVRDNIEIMKNSDPPWGNDINKFHPNSHAPIQPTAEAATSTTMPTNLRDNGITFAETPAIYRNKPNITPGSENIILGSGQGNLS
jgi:hypothetical protein